MVRFAVVFVATVACGTDDDNPSVGSLDAAAAAETGLDASDEGSATSDAGSSDGSTLGDAASSDASDAASDAGAANDDPFDCTSVALTGPQPTYELGAALPAPQGGAVAPGLYRAVKGTHTYDEAAPGDCTGITPPAVTPYRIELDLRPTHYRLAIVSPATAGTWVTSGPKLLLSQTCPDAKQLDPVYTATGNTIVLYGTKQDYLSGGCHYYMQYTLVRQ